MHCSYHMTQTRMNLSRLTLLPTVCYLKHPTYQKMFPISKQVGWTPRVSGGQHQRMVLRYRMEPNLLDFTRTFNIYLIITIGPSLMEEND